MPRSVWSERSLLSWLLPSMHWRAHPYWWASAGVHLLLLVALLAVDRAGLLGDGKAVERPMTPAAMRAADNDLQRRVQTMERIKRELSANAASGERGGDGNNAAKEETAGQKAESPEQKLRRLAEEIDQATLPQRAKELARILSMPEERALEQLKAERVAKAAQSLDQLQQSAQNELIQQRRREEREARGTALSLGSASEASGSPAGPSDPRRDRNMGGPGEMTAGSTVDMRDYGEMLQPPVIDAKKMTAGTGHIVGAKGVYANRFYIDRWYLIGPFPGSGSLSMDEVFPPEKLVDLDAIHTGAGGRALRWIYHRFPRYPLIPPDSEDSAVYYGYTELKMEEARTVWMSFGADDDAKVWLNGEVIWQSGNGDKPWYHQHFKNLSTNIAELNLTEKTQRVALKKGANKILFKLYNGTSATFFSMVIAP
jgi:hypothetical protein